MYIIYAYHVLNFYSYSECIIYFTCVQSVADALAYFGNPATEETETFCRTFDRFFDCLKWSQQENLILSL